MSCSYCNLPMKLSNSCLRPMIFCFKKNTHYFLSSGIDSRYNDGSRELINYLLFDLFDVRKDEIER